VLTKEQLANIECGLTTCHVSPGDALAGRCIYSYHYFFEPVRICHLFNEPLIVKDGIPQRLPKCIEAKPYG
jgi:hypothetical protein